MATLNDFVDEINHEISEYAESVKKELEQKLDETATLILEYVISNTPRSGRKGAMADEFVKTDIGKGHTKTIVIHAKEKGRLVHLIEFGFQHKSGKYVAARPFMRPAFDYFTPKMLDDIRRIIRGN